MKEQNPHIVVVGSINMDIVVETSFLPKEGETTLGNRVQLLPGGKGANQAVAASRLGASATMLGAVGQDSFGEQMLRELERQSVECAVTVMPEQSTGVASIWIHNRDNRIIVVPGANEKLAWCDLERFKPLIDAADIVLLQLEISLNTVVEVVRYASGRGKKVVLNPAPARPLPKDIYPLLHTLTPNRSELAILTGMPEALEPGNRNALRAAMEKLISLGLPSVTVTLGAEGAAYLDASGQFFLVPGRKVEVADTTGAGDCFNASLAVSLAKGWTMRRAVEYAIAASALSVTEIGAQNGMPRDDNVTRFLNSLT